jgi:hypothetical protein
VAEEDTETSYYDERLERTVIPATLISGFVARAKQPIVLLGATGTREELSTPLTRSGATLGSWQDVPEDVPRDLASTAAWVLSQG